MTNILLFFLFSLIQHHFAFFYLITAVIEYITTLVYLYMYSEALMALKDTFRTVSHSKEALGTLEKKNGESIRVSG